MAKVQLGDHERKVSTVERVCDALSVGNTHEASKTARREYPFIATASETRRYTPYQSCEVFIRDGFIDRYAGTRLVFPGALRALSIALPAEFPAHPNWKMSESHIVYWELSPTVDHVVPVSRGGKDEMENWVTTSMLRNSAKSNWTLEELGWELEPPGDLRQWDGLTGWFLKYVREHEHLLDIPYIRTWHRAVNRTSYDFAH
jgi:5-methylcytosine-specific restriction endonuclease McrA